MQFKIMALAIMLGFSTIVCAADDVEKPSPASIATPRGDSALQPQDPQAQNLQTQDSQAQDSQAQDSQTQDSQAQDSQAQDSQAQDSQTQDSQAQDSQAQDSQAEQGLQAQDSQPQESSVQSAKTQDQPDATQPVTTSKSLMGDNDVSPAPADLWERIRSGFALADMDTPLVRENEQWYADRPEYVQRMMERSRLYLFHIVEEVEKRGMPTEIALLPMIESAYNPKAYSRSHASGIWQFIPSTGKNFGLEQNWWYDGRRDILAATDAALDYLQKLHDMFGSWELALASYNWGEGAVSRALARNQSKGLPTDYLSLSLPPETRNYVPRLIAVKNIVMHPEAFGLALATIPNEPYFTHVATHRQMDLKVAARLAEIPVDEFVSLNPAYNRPVVTLGSTKGILLPVEKAEVFSANLSGYSKPLLSWKTYAARKGERPEKIAKKFGISLAKFTEVNDLVVHRNRLARNQMVLVPTSNHSEADGRPMQLANVDNEGGKTVSFVRSTGGLHHVQRGDTLFSIANRYGVTAAQLKIWNKLKSNHIALGQKLVVANATSAKAVSTSRQAGHEPSGKRAVYTVRRGDTLHSIARRFDVAVNDLQRWNKLASHRLRPGQKVTVYLIQTAGL
jgi:membrane-bound lytic murein transglycosylase D